MKEFCSGVAAERADGGLARTGGVGRAMSSTASGCSGLVEELSLRSRSDANRSPHCVQNFLEAGKRLPQWAQRIMLPAPEVTSPGRRGVLGSEAGAEPAREGTVLEEAVDFMESWLSARRCIRVGGTGEATSSVAVGRVG